MSNIFDDLNDGLLNNESDGLITESYQTNQIPYLKTVVRQVLLPIGKPIGKGNLCFLYSHNLDESIELMTNKINCIDMNRRYNLYYYNLFYQGRIYNKKYRFRDYDIRKEYYDKISKAGIGITPLKRIINGSDANRNMYYDLFRYIEIFENICSKVPFKKYIPIYWEYFKSIYNLNFDGYTNKFVIIDLTNFGVLKKSLKDNIHHPLFIVYYTLYKYPEILKDIDVDMIFFNGKRLIKINPSQLAKDDVKTLKIEMKKVMTGISSLESIDDAVSEDNIQKDEILNDSVNKVINKIDPVESDTNEVIITNNNDLHKISEISRIEKTVTLKAKAKMDNLPSEDIKKASKNKESHEKLANDINISIRKELDSNKEEIQKAYNANKRATISPKSSISTARDEMLRQNQANIKIDGMTIADIEKADPYKIKIPVQDVSKSVTTTNENMKEIRFANLDKTYNDKLMKKDITNAILSLNDKSLPIFVRDIEVKDTSDELNYKDTYIIHMEDANRKRHTIKVDIPKFIDDKFLYIGGNKKLIKHQSFYYPIVKTGPDTVQIVTNYSKMTIERNENKSITPVEKMKKFVTKSDEAKKYFSLGSCYISNKGHITTIEYDDLSKFITEFKVSGKTFIIFDQDAASDYMVKNGITNKDDCMFIGKENGSNIFININTQTDEAGYSISEIIARNLPDNLNEELSKVKTPKRLMFTKVKIMSQYVYVGLLLGMWEGLSTLLKKMKCDYRIEDRIPSVMKPDEEFIKFKDEVLIYKANMLNSLILNGFKQYDTTEFTLDEFNTKEAYIPYIKKVYGKTIIENALENFYEFAIDPITKEILEALDYPTKIVDVFIYAVNLLSDSQFENDISQNLSRIRCGEIIPAILYERISKNYVMYKNSGGKKTFSLPQDCVIKEILDQKTVEDYSTLNPILEIDQLHAVSTKGFRGVNLDDAYTMERRGFDNSMVGILSPNTSPDGNCGISRYLTLEPEITNLRGFTEDKFAENKLGELKDVNVFAPGDLSMPLGVTLDDPQRLGHANKQSHHVIPVKNSSPVLISNGFEETVRFHLSSSFVINAEDDGEIVDYDENLHIMIAKYKNGKCRSIDLNPNIVKNGGGGFFLSNILTTELKVGDKFKKNDILAYHKDFFTNDKFNDCRMNMGTLAKVAIMSTYNTYEDATCITHKLSEEAATEMCFLKSAVIGKNSNVFYIAKKGQEITVGDPLVKFDTSFEDDTINALLANLAEKEKESVLEGAKNEIKSKYSGVIEDIKIYSTVELDDMSDSLRKIVSSYYGEINKKKKFLEKYDPDSKDSIVKCGQLVTDTTKPISPNRFGVIKGEHVDDSVLIEFYIKHSEPLEVGSKIANFTALKNTIGEIIPEGYEPYSTYRPDEEISTFIASNSILKRMVPSILLTSLGYKCIIELKRHLKEMNYNRVEMEKLIYDFFTAMDKSGTNTKKYKALFEPMTDNQFKSYFKNLFDNDKAYLVLDVVDYEHTLTMEDIKRAASVIDVPLFEKVALPHVTMDKKNVVMTKEPVPVGYICIKRTQQTVADIKYYFYRNITAIFN